MALRGDDLIAIKNDGKRLQILKGEIKSRRNLTATTVRNALAQLRKNSNRPSAHTVNYIVDRLQDLGEDQTAELLDAYLDSGISSKDLHHLMFTLSANDPTSLFDTQLGMYRGPVWTAAVGLIIEDHPEFIKESYEKLIWQPSNK
jgi:hypothetical protein